MVTNLVLVRTNNTTIIISLLTCLIVHFACQVKGEPQVEESQVPDAAYSYDCMDCNESLLLNECFPENARDGGSLLFRCIKCYNKHTKFLANIDQQNQKVRKQQQAQLKEEVQKKQEEQQEAAKKKQEQQEAAKTKPKNTTNKKGAATKKGSDYSYALWDKVLCEYTGFDGTYPAEIYSRTKGSYNVYFLKDHTFETNVSENKIKPPPLGAKWAALRRRELLGQTFVEGDSTYEIISLGKGGKKHHYLCRSDSGEDLYKTVGSVQNICGEFGW